MPIWDRKKHIIHQTKRNEKITKATIWWMRWFESVRLTHWNGMKSIYMVWSYWASCYWNWPKNKQLHIGINATWNKYMCTAAIRVWIKRKTTHMGTIRILWLKYTMFCSSVRVFAYISSMSNVNKGDCNGGHC